MTHRTSIEYQVLSSELIEEIRRVLPMLSSGGPFTVSLSSELAHVLAKFLRAAAEQGAVAFAPVSPEINGRQAAKVLATEFFS